MDTNSTHSVSIQPAVQCLCGQPGLVGGLTIEQIEGFNNLSSLLLEDTSSWFPTTCMPQTTAIWWLLESEMAMDHELLRARYVLAMLFAGWNALDWTDNTYWLSERPICSWEGITCRDGILTELSLADHGLTGGEEILALEAIFAFLPSLERLDLRSNRLAGSLASTITITPPSFLTYLDLSHNQFMERLPVSLWNESRLMYLNVSHNPDLIVQVGPSPTEQQPPPLQELDLRNTIASGNLDPFCHETSMYLVDCSDALNCSCCLDCPIV
eukprot:CAMPEP_0116836150 /NCGR_PEP_ID=MMETSP0418-20121206/7934_1 /TAXON_ID=1158023 /ORGANISM="Astrosyne radiata, Strain 13vi08-1A" /LENGTH=269 /DNA_ID=CAMNT_0004465883 /DNA_START=191 /DNA_END=1000 /DNA_ORIENTATION=+